MGRLLLLGDSLTAGQPGVSYPGMMSRLGCTHELVVEGRGGATVTEVRWRLNPLIASCNPDIVLLEVGANDILIPLFHRRGGAWKKLARDLQFRGSVPMATPDAFQQAYDGMLSAVTRSVRIILATIACLGENPRSETNIARNRYNAIIRAMGNKHGAGIADVAAVFDAELEKVAEPSPYFFDRHSSTFLDALVTAPDAGSDYLARRRGLHLTMDGAHLNSLGARLYAETVISAIQV